MEMNVLRQLQQDWFGNVRNDLLAGLVVALALIPEAIAFSIIAGVDHRETLPRWSPTWFGGVNLCRCGWFPTTNLRFL